MRTTVDLDDALLKRARGVAAKEKTTLTAIIERALAAFLLAKVSRRTPFKLKVQTERGTYLGHVDPANRDLLYEEMERDS